MYSLKLSDSKNNIIDINDGVNYVVLDVQGLNPPKANLYSSKSPNRAGSKYNGSSLGDRSISLTIRPLGNVEKNRNRLYDWVDTEQYVKVLYSNKLKSVFAEGHIEECEINFFDEIEVIDVLITCNDPYWKELLEIMTEINRIKSNFKFPFSIKKKGMPFSIIRDSVNATIYNKSSETGMEIRFYFTDTVTSPMIYDIDDNTKYIWLKDITFNKGETVVITTEGSPKKITKYDVNGTPSNILYTASENLTWLKIKKGINRLGVKATNTDELKHIEVVVSWRRKYKGV